MDPPRPLEPRPTHDGAFHAHNGPVLDRRADVFAYTGQIPITRAAPPGPTSNALPSVRDILSPQVHPSVYPVHEQYAAQHYSPATHHSHLHPQEYYQRPPVSHPPVAHLPRPDQYSQPYVPQERRWDLPAIETQSAATYQHPVASPYGPPFRDTYRESEAMYSRPRQQSASSYATGSVSSPYTPNTYDEVVPRSSNGTYDQGVPPPFPTNGTETTKRYLGVQDFPGEGAFHVYEGGHRLPIEVDGEVVNPQWGLTKANKPRKRLAIACLDCREKKIKCEPGASSCLQCEKAKRPCRRGPSAPHQHENGTNTDWSSNAGSPGRSTTFSATDLPPPERDLNAAKRRATDDMSTTEAVKRQKSLSPAGHKEMVLGGVNGIVMHGTSPHTPEQRQYVFADNVDPMSIERGLALQLLETYLSVFNTGVYALFPRDKFKAWAKEQEDKTASEIMVLYAIMAVATIYHEPNLANLGEHCAKLASNALGANFGKFSLQITQTRLLLALWSFAKGDRGSSWEHCGTAMRSISALRLNNEDGCAATRDRESRVDYGLSFNQIAECRRRTFWCGFMMDRLYGSYEGMLCTVEKADIYLRLPCANQTYEQGGRSEAPFFDNGCIDATDSSLAHTTPVSGMAHLALVISIWADVWKFVNRGIHRSEEGHTAAYEAFYEQIHQRLKEWSANLPAHLQYSLENVRHSVHQRYAGELVTMHILYESTLVKLNRCIRWRLMPDRVARNICEAHIHAGKVLGIVAAFNDSKAEAGPGHTHQHFSTPFTGYAILSAIDVISAGGHDDLIGQTIASMQHAQTFLHAQGDFWTIASEQAKHADKRFQQLRNIIVRPYKANSGCWLGREWGMEESLDKKLDWQDDCIYGVHHNTYFEALGKIRGSTHLKHNSRSELQER